MINIGQDLTDQTNIEINLQNLIATRLLIQANSGGGKSWLIRRLLEQTHGKVQQIVIDLEGEFSTLREKHDYLLVGTDGEIPANIKTAELLAKRLLELNVSTIIDLSELKHHERITFVKRFIDSLINAPKKLWRPVLVVVDEADQFCPQTAKSESSSSIIDLMCRGRKRGYCGVIATQRISKLHKDACAEANNRLIGRTGLDIDRKRASEELGFTKKEDELKLRFLKPGQFYAFGPSISEKIVKMEVGEVNTTHPEAGKGILVKASPTPENIKKLLKDVINLGEEAEEELRTINDFKLKINELKIELRKKPKPPQPLIDERKIEQAKQIGYHSAIKETQRVESELKKQANEYQKIISGMQNKFKQIARLIDVKIPEFKPVSRVEIKSPLVLPKVIPKLVGPEYEEKTKTVYEGEINLNLCERKLYSLLAQYSERSFTKSQIGVFTGYSYTSGGFSNAISRLRTMDLIEGSGHDLKVKTVNTDLMGEFNFSKEEIISKLKKCEKEIYNVLLENPYEEYLKEELAGLTPSDYSPTSGGFSNAISRLNTLGIIQRNSGKIKLEPGLLEL